MTCVPHFNPNIQEFDTRYVTYWWDGYDDGNLPVDQLADTPAQLCQRAGRPDTECQFARFMHVPAIATNVTISTGGLVPIIGTTAVRLRAGVRLRNTGGTSPVASTAETTTLHGSFGSFEPPRIVSVVASDEDNSAPGFSDGDIIRIRFDVALSVRYRNWESAITNNPNLGTVAGVSGGRPLVDSLFTFSGKLGETYGGLWEDDQTFKVTISDTRASYGVEIGTTIVRAKRCPVLTAYLCGDVMNAARTSDPSEDASLLQVRH